MTWLKALALVFFCCLPYSMAADSSQAKQEAARNHIQTLLLAEPGAEQECKPAKSGQAQLTGCDGRLSASAEQHRKNAETAAMAAMKRLDAANKSTLASKAFAQDMLSYEQYKKAHCNWIRESGNGSPVACETDLDRARAHALSLYYMR